MIADYGKTATVIIKSIVKGTHMKLGINSIMKN